MSTEEWTICWLRLVPSNASLERLDGGMERRVRFATPFGRVRGVHDRRVVAAEQLADPWVGRIGESTAEIHGQLSRHGDLLCTAA